MMMKLLTAAISPFGRKVRLAAGMKGVAGQIEIQPADTNSGDATLNTSNPLGKIPCLILADGQALYDSHVICEYLDSLAPSPVLFPKSGEARWRTLTLGAVANGICEATVLLVYEKRFRPEHLVVQSWVDRQQSKISRALAQLEAAPPTWSDMPDYGHLTLASALGYLDARQDGVWRSGHPKLVEWLDAFARDVPAFEATRA
jgi:glutathione S-transferase